LDEADNLVTEKYKKRRVSKSTNVVEDALNVVPSDNVQSIEALHTTPIITIDREPSFISHSSDSSTLPSHPSDGFPINWWGSEPLDDFDSTGTLSFGHDHLSQTGYGP
jgi:hypothetical protein